MNTPTNTIRNTIKNTIKQLRLVKNDQAVAMITSHGWNVLNASGDLLNKLSDGTYNWAGVWHSTARWEKDKAQEIANKLGDGATITHYTDNRDAHQLRLESLLNTMLMVRHN